MPQKGKAMNYLKLISNTIWFRCHPATGPVAPDDPTPTQWFTWREAFELARMFGV